jgi:Na+/proline symporter
MLLGLVIFFVPPIYSRVFLESDVLAMNISPKKAAEYAYSVACANVLPSGTLSFIFLAIFATAISSLDTGLNRNAALIVRDLLPAYRKLLGLPPIRPDREVMFGKFATLILGGGVVSVALCYSLIKNTSIFDVMLTIIAQLISPQVIPLMLFLFIRKVPRWAIFSSLIGGYLPSLIVLILSFTTNATFSYQQKGLMVLVGSVLGFAVARLFWNRVGAEEKAMSEAFYAKMMKPVDFESEVGKSNDSLQLIMIGRFSMIAGGLIMLLAFPVETSSGRLVIFSVSGFVGGIGALMLFIGKRMQRNETAQENANR